jgi:hypothetical protein
MLTQILVIFSLSLAAATAAAYSTNSVEIKMNEFNLVTSRNSGSTSEVSLSLDVKTKSTDLPVVLELDQNTDCVHKKTLISFSGYDRAHQLYVRTYEIQIQNKSNKFRATCEFLIVTDKNTQNQQRASVRIVF